MNLRTLSAALLVVAASVVWMSATASATILTSPAGTVYTGTIAASAEGHVTLDNPIAAIQCGSSVSGSVETHGEGVTAGGNISSLIFTGCTNSWHVTVVSAGSLQVHATGSGNGTLTSSGATVEATRFGIICRYATSSTDIGTLTGGENPTLDVSAAIPFHSGSGLCGSSPTTWTGSYEVTTPAALEVVDAQLEQTVLFNGEIQANNECKFDKEKLKTQWCTVEFKVTGKGEDKWEVEKSELINGAGQYEVKNNCAAKVLKSGNSCTDEITNIKNEKAEATWCVYIKQPGGVGAGPHCTFLKK